MKVKVKGQGAIEYLFMVAVAFIVIAIVWQHLKKSASNTASTVDQGATQLNNELNSELNNATS